MTRLTLQRALDRLRLMHPRARGLEPGDDLVSRLRLDELRAAPSGWLATTLAKLAVVSVLAVLAAALFAGGIAVMRAVGIEHRADPSDHAGRRRSGVP